MRVLMTIVESRVQDVSPSAFEVLQSGDILLIDSSHVLRTGSDVCYELFEIMPRLSPGILVHFHDIFWPFEYPYWMNNENRSWSEIYAVRVFLTGQPRLAHPLQLWLKARESFPSATPQLQREFPERRLDFDLPGR